MKYLKKFESYNIDENLFHKFKKKISKIKRVFTSDLEDSEVKWSQEFISSKENEEFLVAVPDGAGNKEILIISKKPDSFDSLKYYTIDRDTKEVVEVDSDF
jgi:hypothetical protein